MPSTSDVASALNGAHPLKRIATLVQELGDATSIPWKEYTAPDGRTYYYNKDTKESRWTVPEELQKLKDKAATAGGMAGQGQRTAAAAAAAAGVADGSAAKAAGGGQGGALKKSGEEVGTGAGAAGGGGKVQTVRLDGAGDKLAGSAAGSPGTAKVGVGEEVWTHA